MENNKSMGVLDLVRQEIERLRKLVEEDNYYLDNYEQALGYGLALDDIGQFLDTLSEEPDKSLEETAADFVWAVMENDYYGPSELSKKLRPTSKLDDFYGALAEIFIAGAKWQKGQLLKGSPLPEDTVIFNKGVAEGKRLMLEGAVEYEVMDFSSSLETHPFVSIPLDNKKYRFGDTVRIIIVKENKE